MNFRQELTYGIIGTIFVFILTGFFISQYNTQSFKLNTNTAIDKLSNQLNTVLTLDEIAKHNTEKDCWMIVGNNVYDVTGYLFLHPGGSQTITQYCGGDGTTGYNSKGGKGSHSIKANTLLQTLLLGALKGSVINSPSKIQQNLLQIPSQQNDD